MKNRRYKLRCSKLQKQIKEMIFLNAALQSEVEDNKKKVSQLQEERKFLLNKLLAFQKEVFSDGGTKILQQALSKKQH